MSRISNGSSLISKVGGKEGRAFGALPSFTASKWGCRMWSKQQILFLLVYLIVFSNRSIAADQLGIHERAYALATSHSCLTDIGIEHDSEERKVVGTAIEFAAESWMRSELRKEVFDLRAESIKPTKKARYEYIVQKDDQVTKVNSAILGDIEKALGDRDALKRFRDQLTQEYAREGAFGNVVRLLGLRMTLERFSILEEEFASLIRDIESSEKHLKYKAVKELLIAEEIASQREIEEASGDLWLGLKSEPTVRSAMQARLFNPYIIKLIAKPRVHAYLELQPEVVAKLHEIHKRLGAEYDDKRLFALLTKTKDLSKVQSEIKEWFAAIDSTVRDAFGDDEKFERLKQILFQEHMAALQFGPALRLIGKEPDRELLGRSNTLFAAAFFEREVTLSQASKELLIDVFPENEAQIEAAFFPLFIPSSPWDTIYNLDKHEKIRAAAIRRFKSTKKAAANVRRE